MMDVGEDAFAAASSPTLEGVTLASPAQEQTAHAIPQVEARMCPDLCNTGPHTPFSMCCFNSPVVYLLRMVNSLYFIFFGVESLGGEPVVRGLVNSFFLHGSSVLIVLLFRQYLFLDLVFSRSECFLLVVPFPILQSAIAEHI